jgi:hypothetical protein
MILSTVLIIIIMVIIISCINTPTLTWKKIVVGLFLWPMDFYLAVSSLKEFLCESSSVFTKKEFFTILVWFVGLLLISLLWWKSIVFLYGIGISVVWFMFSVIGFLVGEKINQFLKI